MKIKKTRPNYAKKVRKHDPIEIFDWANNLKFTDDDITAIIKAAGPLPASGMKDSAGQTRRAYLAGALNQTLRTIGTNRIWTAAPPRSAVADRLKAISSAATTLSEELGPAQPPFEIAKRLALPAVMFAERHNGFAPFPDMHSSGNAPHVDWQPHVAIGRVCQVVGMVAVWARNAEQRERAVIAARSKRESTAGGRNRNKGDVEFRTYLEALYEIYMTAYSRFPGGTKDGPFVRFVDAACRPLGIRKTHGAIKSALDAYEREQRAMFEAPHRLPRWINNR